MAKSYINSSITALALLVSFAAAAGPVPHKDVTAEPAPETLQLTAAEEKAVKKVLALRDCSAEETVTAAVLLQQVQKQVNAFEVPGEGKNLMRTGKQAGQKLVQDICEDKTGFTFAEAKNLGEALTAKYGEDKLEEILGDMDISFGAGNAPASPAPQK